MPQSQDPNSGPFSAFLGWPGPQQAQPTYQSTAPPLTGYEHKGGIIAHLSDSLLQGISQGRARQQQQSERQQATMLGSVNNSIGQIENSQLPDSVKSQELKKLYDMRGDILLKAIDQGDNGKGKDKNPAAGFAKHVITSMLGPGKEKQAFKPEQIAAQLHQSNQVLSQAPQLAAANLEKADAPLRGLVAKYTKDGKFNAQAMYADPDYTRAVTNNYNLTGGQGSPYMKQVQTYGAEQYKSENVQSQIQEREARIQHLDEENKKLRANTPEGREQYVSDLQTAHFSPQAIEVFRKTGKFPSIDKTTATYNNLAAARGVINSANAGKIAKDEPTVEAARDYLDRYYAQTEAVRTGSEVKRANVSLRERAIGISGEKAVTDLESRYSEEERKIRSSVSSGNKSKADGEKELDQLQKRRDTALKKMADAAAPPRSGKSAPPPPPPTPPGQSSEDDMMKEWLGIKKTAAPDASAPPKTGTAASLDDINKYDTNNKAVAATQQ